MYENFINGRMIYCERCNKQLFLKCIGEGESDGGYTRWNKFEDVPKGWGAVYDTNHEGKYICDECRKKFDEKYKQLWNEFWNNEK